MDYSGSGGGTKGQLSQNDKAALMSNIKQQVSVQQGLYFFLRPFKQLKYGPIIIDFIFKRKSFFMK